MQHTLTNSCLPLTTVLNLACHALCHKGKRRHTVYTYTTSKTRGNIYTYTTSKTRASKTKGNIYTYTTSKTRGNKYTYIYI